MPREPMTAIRSVISSRSPAIIYVLRTSDSSRPIRYINYLQFLTIRQYLSLVFTALVILLLVLAIWQ